MSEILKEKETHNTEAYGKNFDKIKTENIIFREDNIKKVINNSKKVESEGGGFKIMKSGQEIIGNFGSNGTIEIGYSGGIFSLIINGNEITKFSGDFSSEKIKNIIKNIQNKDNQNIFYDTEIEKNYPNLNIKD